MTKNKFLTLLLSVGLAFGLWLYVITAVTPEVEMTFHDVPVSLLDPDHVLEQRGLIVTNEEKPTITLTLRGNRVDLNKLKASDIQATVDLTRIYDTKTEPLNPTIHYTGFSDDAFEEVSRQPSSIQVSVDYLKSNVEIPVEVKWLNEEKLAPGYRVYTDERTLDYEKVLISGPATVINEITKAVVYVDLEGRNTSFSESYRMTLCNDAGEGVASKLVTIANVEEVNVTLLVYREREIPLKVSVIPGGGADDATCKRIITPQTIQIAATNSMFEAEDLAGGLLIGELDLAQITEDMTREYDIKLPSGVKLLSDTTKAEVSVSFPDLAKKTITVPADRFVISGVPEGMVHEIVTQELQITLRGPKALMDKLLDTDVTVTVDLSQAQTGTDDFDASVTLGEAYAQVGTLESGYSVSVTLAPVENN